MRHFDLSPLYRSTVGFDRLFSLLDQAGSVEAAPTYPPYNIERTGENAYRITIAVAGFGEGDLAIESKENTLTVTRREAGRRQAEKREVLHQGIAARAFERRFQLADYVQVTGAASRTGCSISISCARSPRPRSPARSPIGGAAPKTIEGDLKVAA